MWETFQESLTNETMLFSPFSVRAFFAGGPSVSRVMSGSRLSMWLDDTLEKVESIAGGIVDEVQRFGIVIPKFSKQTCVTSRRNRFWFFFEFFSWHTFQFFSTAWTEKVVCEHTTSDCTRLKKPTRLLHIFRKMKVVRFVLVENRPSRLDQNYW